MPRSPRLHGTIHPMLRSIRVLSLPIVGFALSLIGCSAGPASLRVAPDFEAGRVWITFTSEGENTFAVAGESCTTSDGSCRVAVPTAHLAGGWNSLPVEAARRTGMEQPLEARVFAGDAVFRRDCEVDEQGQRSDPDSLVYALSCSFPEGFSGELGGAAMTDGRGTIAAADLLAAAPAASSVEPLVTTQLPLVVRNAAGSWPRPIPVVVPAALTQLRVDGWDDPWFEETLSLQIRVEPGAEVLIDGQPVRGPAGKTRFVYDRHLKDGVNELRVEARREGRLADVYDLHIDNRYPHTPLYLDSPDISHLLRDEALAVYEPQLQIRGRTDPRALVTVGRMPIHVDSRGRFVGTVPLEEGRNDVEIIAGFSDDVTRLATAVTFQVEMNPLDQSRRVRVLADGRSEEIRVVGGEDAAPVRALSEVAADPWAALDAAVEFEMIVADQFKDSALGGCTSRIHGEACLAPTTHPVRKGFRDQLAWACPGERVPVVVELADCHEVPQDARVRVTGQVVGGLGSVMDGVTVLRPRVRADRVDELPRLLAAGRGGRR